MALGVSAATSAGATVYAQERRLSSHAGSAPSMAMSGRPPPAKVSRLVVMLQREAKRQAFTAYRLAKDTGLPLRTVQRFLGSAGSPTLSTVETIAATLGLVLEARSADSGAG